MSEKGKRPRTLPYSAVQLALDWPQDAEDKFALLFALNFQCEQGVVMLQDPDLEPGVLKVIGTYGLSKDQLHLAGLLRVDTRAEDLAKLAHQYGMVRMVYTHKDERLGQTEKLIKDAFEVSTLMCGSVIMPDGTLGLIYCCSKERKSPKPHQILQGAQIATSLTLGLHRHLMHQRHQQSVQHLQSLVEQTDDLMLAHQMGVITHLNEGSWLQHLGYTAAELIGQQVLDYLHPEDQQQGIEALEKYQQAPSESLQHLYRYLHKDGHWVPTLWKYQALGGGVFVGRGKVVTSTEAAPKQGDLMVFTVMSQGVTSYSPSLLAYLGISFEEAEGLNWLNLMHPEDRSGALDRFQRTLQVHEAWTAERRMRVHDGSYRWVQVQAFPQFSLDGTFTGYSGVIVDIHDQKMQEQHRSHQGSALN